MDTASPLLPQNNTPVHIWLIAKGYGIQGYTIDGNNVFEVMETIKNARKHALRGKPILIEAKTFRMRGHEEASGTAYVPENMFEEWSKKDPILRFENYLQANHKQSKNTLTTFVKR